MYSDQSRCVQEGFLCLQLAWQQKTRSCTHLPPALNPESWSLHRIRDANCNAAAHSAAGDHAVRGAPNDGAHHPLAGPPALAALNFGAGGLGEAGALLVHRHRARRGARALPHLHVGRSRLAGPGAVRRRGSVDPLRRSAGVRRLLC